MLVGKMKEALIFFPIMKLAKLHKLKYGDIGPVSKLLPKCPTLSKILPAFEKVTVDGEKIEDPVFAASSSDLDKFLGEIEAIAFLTASNHEAMAEEEIFGHRNLFTIHERSGRDWICIDNHALLNPVEILSSIQLQDFPRGFYSWDKEKITNFEPFLKKTLKQGLYKAIVSCLSNAKDKESSKERKRIIISIMLYNQVSIHLALTQPFSNLNVVLLASALEALLDLPSESISSTFQYAVITLIGKRTALLKKWCKEFYDYRSALVHGDVEWGSEEKQFSLSGKKGVPYSVIANHIFVQCLKTKLFLMGLLPDYVNEKFDFEDFINNNAQVMKL